MEAPSTWNGRLLLYSKPIPVEAGEPPWQADDALVSTLVRSGYAVAGSANTIFWPLERAFCDQPALVDTALDVLGTPEHTIGFGLSIGGIMTAGLVQRFPELLSGALPMCGNLAGAVAVHNRELDMAFVVKTLLAPESTLEIVRITNPHANFQAAMTVLREAQGTPAGRARLALAAAIGNIPGWHDPASAEPAPRDFETRQRNQFAWFEEPGFLVFFLTRAQVEMQAGGNGSWNTGVDYAALLASSSNREEVEALYASAGLDLADDLVRLAAEPRVDADPGAVDYLERHIVFDGDLGGVPVLAAHTDGDGLVTPDNQHAYADVVASAGQQDLLRQLFVHRGGHCTFTVAEILTALDALVHRIEHRAWPALDPGGLNDAARALGPDANVLAMGGKPTEAQFFAYEPRPFPRPYDIRHIGTR